MLRNNARHVLSSCCAGKSVHARIILLAKPIYKQLGKFFCYSEPTATGHGVSFVFVIASRAKTIQASLRWTLLFVVAVATDLADWIASCARNDGGRRFS